MIYMIFSSQIYANSINNIVARLELLSKDILRITYEQYWAIQMLYITFDNLYDKCQKINIDTASLMENLSLLIEFLKSTRNDIDIGEVILEIQKNMHEVNIKIQKAANLLSKHTHSNLTNSIYMRMKDLHKRFLSFCESMNQCLAKIIHQLR